MSQKTFADTSSNKDGSRLLASPTTLFWLGLIAALFVGSRLWRLTASCLWFDEIFSVHAARHTWSDLFLFVAADIIHPPLFYALLKVWISLGGESLRWLRLLPALISVATIVPFTLLCRELKLKSSEINLALFLLAVNGYLIKYAQEVRMYSPLFFLSVCSLWLFFRLFNREVRERNASALLCGINLLMVYTHYAGWLVVVLEGVVLLVWQRRKLRGFLMTLGVLSLAYIPWIYGVVKVAKSGAAGQGLAENIGWVARPGISEIVQYFVLLNRPFLFIQSSAQIGYNLLIAALTIILFVIPVLFFLVNCFDRRQADEKNSAILALAVFSFAPAVLAFSISWLSSYSIWGTRHLIIASVPYSILAALALNRLSPDWLRISVFAVAGAWILLSAGVFVFSRPPNFIWCSWEQLAQEMSAAETNSREPVSVYAYEDLVAYHLWFALHGRPHGKFKVSVVKNVPGIPEDPAYFLPRAFSDVSVQRNHVITGDRIWVAFRTTQWDTTRPPLNFLSKEGFAVGQVFTVKAQGQHAFLVQLARTSNPTSEH